LIAAQQQQISKLVDSMQEQKQLLEQSLRNSQAGSAQVSSAQPLVSPLPSFGEVASLQPVIPLGPASTNAASSALLSMVPASAPSAQNAQAQQPSQSSLFVTF
jgi:hypothetical protein